MLPYHPNSDALLPPLALAPLPAAPVFSARLPVDDSVFTRTGFAPFFFSFLASIRLASDFSGLDLGCAGDFVAFAITIFLGALAAGFEAGLGVVLGFAVGFGKGVCTGVGFGNSISLFACVTGSGS